MSDIQFVDGLIAKAPRDGSPDFVKCQLSLKRLELIKWLEGQEGEWVNVDVKESKAGKWFAAVNTWKPNGEKAPAKQSKEGHYDKGGNYHKGSDDFQDDELPF